MGSRIRHRPLHPQNCVAPSSRASKSLAWLRQRELILGDRQTGKTSIALSTILNQTRVNSEILSKNNVLSVYVSIGQRCSNVARIHRLLTEYDAMKFCTIVAATAADPAAQGLCTSQNQEW